MKVSQILINIDDDLKKDFKETCKDLGVNMTDVIISKIKEFTKNAKSKTK